MLVKQLSEDDIKRMINELQKESIQPSKRLTDLNQIAKNLRNNYPLGEDQKYFVVKMYNDYFLTGKVGRK